VLGELDLDPGVLLLWATIDPVNVIAAIITLNFIILMILAFLILKFRPSTLPEIELTIASVMGKEIRIRVKE